eukprot:gnl/Spiro4/18236_TR9747_c0_g1_i1.p1 gnl/Spiro4/18236_TR9747_c0_g1~~gnl/Spiro4/18236_TR9747_c0_g1_i1.p1  ORF type:complete len:417 (-),score=117.83 gnl/Spiro4/18236_TR9747_c0_g1_i1:107-1357(-)
MLPRAAVRVRLRPDERCFVSMPSWTKKVLPAWDSAMGSLRGRLAEAARRESTMPAPTTPAGLPEGTRVINIPGMAHTFASKRESDSMGGKRVKPYVLPADFRRHLIEYLLAIWGTAKFALGHPHRAYLPQDRAFIRFVSRDMPSARNNPGLRIEPSFISNAEAMDMVSECEKLVAGRGVDEFTPEERAQWPQETAHLSHPHLLNSLRVSGRRLSRAYPPADWGVGDAFNENELPPGLRLLHDRIRAMPYNNMGDCIDVTITYRHSGCNWRPPRVCEFPEAGTKCSINLLGPSVFTFVKPESLTPKKIRAMAAPRTTPELWADFSYTQFDLDVLMIQHSLLHMSGDVLHKWPLGNRLGTEPPEKTTLCDWWGDNSMLIWRAGERYQIDLHFLPYKKGVSRPRPNITPRDSEVPWRWK